MSLPPPRVPMQLVLPLPGLLAPPLARTSDAPRLARLLAVAGAPAREPDGLDAVLAASYGVARAPDGDVPLASIRLAALGVDPGASWWLAAHPVSLEAGRDDVRLAGAARDLAPAEADALLIALNGHFGEEGLAFVAPRPDAWFVRTRTRCAMKTRPLAVAEGRMLRGLLCTGPDSGAWRRRQNEAGMLLHAHPVNVERERAGKAPVNGLWFADGGALPPRPGDAGVIATFARSETAVALAARTGRPALPFPGNLDAAVAAAAGARAIVVALDAPLDVEDVERDWTAPAWTSLASGALDAVTIVADGGEGAVAWTARRPGVARRVALALGAPDLASLLAAVREEP